MEVDENIEADVRAMFGITADPEPAPTPEAPKPEAPATEEGSAPAADEKQSTPTGETKGTESTENAAPAPTPATETASKAETPAKDTSLDPAEKFSKQNFAFAQMRTENKDLSDLLMDLAKATGQNPKNITEAKEILQGGLTKVLSKNRNIPEDVLREMEEDKKALAALKQEQAKQKAMQGFQTVKNTFGLSNEEVNSFADELIKRKLNPFEHEIDLTKEYRDIYFDKLIAKAKEAGVQEERARIMKAQQQSTTPSIQNGVSDNTGNQKEIKTVADLNAFFDSLK